MTGGKAALWVDEDTADVLTGKALGFIEKLRAGPRGDAIAELDSSVGQVLDKLEALGLSKNTIVMFSSDNGAAVDDGYKDDAVEKLGGHKPAGPLRGWKYSNFEGGTRVPLIVRWPERVKPGVSGAVVGQQDLLASLAHLTGGPCWRGCFGGVAGPREERQGACCGACAGSFLPGRRLEDD